MLRTLRLLVVPKLSPTMTHGRIVKLAIKPLQVVSSYDKVMEISTTSLLNTVEEEAVMDIEVMEDMYVAKVFAQQGQQLHVGSPVALLCDNEKDIEHVQGIKIPVDFDAYNPPPGSDAKSIPIAIWQAYAKVEVEGCK